MQYYIFPRKLQYALLIQHTNVLIILLHSVVLNKIIVRLCVFVFNDMFVVLIYSNSMLAIIA